MRVRAPSLLSVSARLAEQPRELLGRVGEGQGGVDDKPLLRGLLSGASSSPRPSRIRWARSAGVMPSALARASRTETEARTSRPCSSHVYQVIPTPASWAT